MPLSAANKTVAAGYRHESLNMHSKNKTKKTTHTKETKADTLTDGRGENGQPA